MHVRDFFVIWSKPRDSVQAEEDRRVALAPAEKDYPCILLTLVTIYLLHIFFFSFFTPALALSSLLPDPSLLAFFRCEAIALVHRWGIHCTALLEIQMYYYEAAVSGWLRWRWRRRRRGGWEGFRCTCVSLTPFQSDSLHPPFPPPGISLYGGL